MTETDQNPARWVGDLDQLSRRAVLIGGATVAGVAGVAALAACSPSGGGGDAQVTASADGGLVALADVPVGGAILVETADGDQIVVAQPTAGQVAAFSAVCTHMGCIVRPEGAELHCPCHGSRFQAGTGEVVEGPAKTPLPPVPVRVDGDRVVGA